MDDKLFDNPVFVKDGKFTVVEVASIRDAIDFLDEWPAEQQDSLHEMTMRVCISAHKGNDTLSSARDAFAKWAKAANILEDIASVPAWMTGPKSGPGGVLV